VLVGVDDDHVGGSQRGPVEPLQQPGCDPTGHAAVLGRVGRADQVIEHDRSAGEQPPGQVHIEVTEVADQHQIGHG
jgi:hypothetical protein